jgi:uncharacterized protein YbjT (DUF2867 family)
MAEEPKQQGQAGRIALVAGANGLVGSHLVDLLLAAPDYTRVYALSRRPLPREHARLANRIVNFERLESELKGFACHDAFCCLGTTLKAAGSEAAFRKIDLDMVVAFARAALAAQARRFIVVSAVGADLRQKNFYLRVKGEMERALETVRFSSLDIMQPALLLGSRAELRPLEAFARLAMPVVNPLLLGPLERYRGIPARTVAQAMLSAARFGRRGVHRYTYPALQALAKKSSLSR